MKKTILIIIILIITSFLFYLIYDKHKEKIIYYSFKDTEINYINYKNINIILNINDSYKLNNNKLVEVLSNKKIIKIKNNTIYAKNIGTAEIKIKTNKTYKRMFIKVIPKEKLIKIKNNFTLVFKEINNNSLSLQNFDFDKNNIYISFVKKSNIKTDYKNCLYNEKILNEINKVIIKKYKNNKYKGMLTLNNSGHGQSFVVLDNFVYTTGDSYGYLDNKNRCWGKGKELIKVRWKKDVINASDASFKFKFYNKEGTLYNNPEISIDKKNNLVALNVKEDVLVWKLNDFKKGKLNNMLYKFKLKNNIKTLLNEEKIYKQGSSIYGGYYYQMYGLKNGNFYILIYNMNGEVVKSIKYYLEGKNLEAEGIKIYDGNIFIGATKKDKSYIYKIS